MKYLQFKYKAKGNVKTRLVPRIAAISIIIFQANVFLFTPLNKNKVFLETIAHILLIQSQKINIKYKNINK